MADWTHPWSLEGEPLALARYVDPDAVAQHLGLPGPSNESAIVRLREVYNRLAALGIGYCDPAPGAGRGRQLIRAPHAVLRAPRHATCLDIALVICGACITAGLHPSIAIVDPDLATDTVGHSVVLIRLDHPHEPRSDGLHRLDVWFVPPPELLSDLLTDLDGPGDVVALDPVGLGTSLSPSCAPGLNVQFPEAVQQGAAHLRDGRWRLGVDIGRAWQRLKPSSSARAGPAGPENAEGPISPLDELFVSQTERIEARTPAGLLREENEIVEFRGRTRDLRILKSWVLQADALLSCVVLTGSAGQGKTRLVRELMKDADLDDWVCGWLRRDRTGNVVDFDRLNELATRRTLIAIDYAETRTIQLDRLLGRLDTIRSEASIRLILIARGASAGRGWWDRLRMTYPALLSSTQHLALTQADGGTGEPSWTTRERVYEFEVAKRYLADGLARLHPGIGWAELRARIFPSPQLGGTRYNTRLSIHLAALLDMLDGAGMHPANSLRPAFLISLDPETELLHHERRYWVRHAQSIKLLGRLPDEDTLLDIVATATLMGAADQDEALATLSLVPGLSEADEKTLLLADSFVVQMLGADGHNDSRWGSLEPDRIGEWHVGNRLRYNATLVTKIIERASPEQFTRAREIIARASDHQPHLASVLAKMDQLKKGLEADPTRLSTNRASEAVLGRFARSSIEPQGHLYRSQVERQDTAEDLQ